MVNDVNIQMRSGTRCSRWSKHTSCLMHDTLPCQLDVKMTNNYQRPSSKWYKLPLCMARNSWSLAMQPDFLKGRVVCGTVYGDMHLKDLLGSIVRVGYRIPVPDFYLVL